MRVNSVARVGFGTVHPVLQELAAAVTGLVGARGSVVGCHSALAEAKGKVPGLRTVSLRRRRSSARSEDRLRRSADRRLTRTCRLGCTLGRPFIHAESLNLLRPILFLVSAFAFWRGRAGRAHRGGHLRRWQPSRPISFTSARGPTRGSRWACSSSMRPLSQASHSSPFAPSGSGRFGLPGCN